MIKIAGFGLVGLHLMLWLWAFGGMLEWLLPAVPWTPYSNPDFTRGLLFFHWTSVLIAASVFLAGYFTQWSYTPHAMALCYGMLAIVCAVETFGYMSSLNRYWAMAFEYVAYLLIAALLFLPSFRELHFARS